MTGIDEEEPLSVDAAVGRVIQDLVKARGESQTDFAARVAAASGNTGMSQQAVSSIMVGNRKRIGLEEVLHLAYCLDVSPISLLTKAHQVGKFSVAGQTLGEDRFRDWIFENACLDGQDIDRFRELQTSNRLRIAIYMWDASQLYANLEVAFEHLAKALLLKDRAMFDGAVKEVQRRLAQVVLEARRYFDTLGDEYGPGSAPPPPWFQTVPTDELTTRTWPSSEDPTKPSVHRLGGGVPYLDEQMAVDVARRRQAGMSEELADDGDADPLGA